jgi:8-oxo-dGTP pyrophosphatase MutT (NUDIX family)
VYENAWIAVTEDSVTRPDGTDGIYGVVELKHDAVFIVAITDADEVVLVTVDRHTVGRSIEVPAGGTDGEPALLAAQRELLEETGFRADTWREIGTMHALNGVCRATERVFLATGLSVGQSSAHEMRAEGIHEVHLIPWTVLLEMVRDGRITDGETIAALFSAAIALNRVS